VDREVSTEPATCDVCDGAPERWLPVVGHDGYAVSNHGRVRSLDRDIPYTHPRSTRTANRKWRGQLLTLIPHSAGYRTVHLGRHGKVYVHHLVLEAFRAPRPPGQEALHGDDNPAHNHPGNLKWGTSAENKRDVVDHGRHPLASQVTCKRGHHLVPPNLRSMGPGGTRRGCVACQRAHSWINTQRRRKGVTLTDFQGIADRYYAAIMAEVAA
jgi:hypothetical protein